MNQTNHIKRITPPQRIWIIGAGKFGRISLEALGRGRRTAEITVVDNDPAQLAHLAGMDVTPILADGIDFLQRRLVSPGVPDWIIPVIPVHVAAEWIRLHLAARGPARWLAVPATVAAGLPNPVNGPNGCVYTSLADFLCPDDCPQPPAHCTRTGEARPCNLYDQLAAIRIKDFRSVVVVSHQLAPGVGALAPPDLFRALAAAGAQRSPCLISTSCRCHGVVSAIGFGPP